MMETYSALIFSLLTQILIALDHLKTGKPAEVFKLGRAFLVTLSMEQPPTPMLQRISSRKQ